MQGQKAATAAWSKSVAGLTLALLLDGNIKEGARMKYISAKALLPDALVEELQGYIQGGYIYVPTTRARRKRWGEASGYREELRKRNQEIKSAYRQGETAELLAERYCLSTHAIRKIVYEK